MESSQLQTDNEIIFFVVYILPIILVIWLIYEIGIFQKNFAKGRPVALAVAISSVLLYILSWMGATPGGYPTAWGNVAIVIILGAGLLERARRRTPFGPNSIALSVIASIAALYLWSWTSYGHANPDDGYLLVIICVAIGFHYRRVAGRSKSAAPSKS